MELLRDTILKVDLGKIGRNMDKIRGMVGPDVAVMPVIKANGYGCGAVGIAPTLMEHGAAYLAVAALNEAMELREAYPDYPLFVLGFTPGRLAEITIENRITQTLVNLSQAKAFSDAALALGMKAKVHLKVDTGFHRLGTADKEELLAMAQLPGLDVEGIFSHLALAGEEEDEAQFRLFMECVDYLEARGVSLRYKHIDDSISLGDYPQYRLNMVRPGALVFGLLGFHKATLDVEQCMSMESRISQIHEIKAGEGVSYDYLWRAPRDTRVGTVPVGYADGYPRNMRDKGYLTVRGVKCPTVGVLCMDQLMIDLTDCPDAQEGDVAIIYGDGSGNTMSIPEAAQLAGTNKNEIIARILARPPRVYVK
ncbi:MAG: alanine racemase [Clostridia bacterium]|nr:alanine racemase [Clostridia bacterium]